MTSKLQQQISLIPSRLYAFEEAKECLNPIEESFLNLESKLENPDPTFVYRDTFNEIHRSLFVLSGIGMMLGSSMIKISHISYELRDELRFFEDNLYLQTIDEQKIINYKKHCIKN